MKPKVNNGCRLLVVVVVVATEVTFESPPMKRSAGDDLETLRAAVTGERAAHFIGSPCHSCSLQACIAAGFFRVPPGVVEKMLNCSAG